MTLDSLFGASVQPPSKTGVNLYRGPATLFWEATGKSESLALRLGLYWRPSPYVSLQLEEVQDDGEPRAGAVSVQLPGTRGMLDASVRYHTFTGDLGDPPSTKGVPYIGQGSVQGGELGGGRLREVRFGVVNFPNLMELKAGAQQRPHWGPLDGPLLLTGAGWNVTLDPAPVDELQSGYADASWVSHVGRAVRESGRTFWPRQAVVVVTGLRSLLTFARGAHAGPFLAVATDRDGHHQWSLWDWEEFDRLDGTDFPPHTWLGEDHAGALQAAFPAWMAAWSDERLRPRMDLAVSLRADAAARSANTGVVIGQQALEQLAWLLLGSEPGLDSLRASDRLRRALSAAGRTAEVPRALEAILEQEGWDDGVHAIVEVRNALVHPTPARQLSPWVLDAMEAWRELALFYIDVLVLALIERH